MWTIQQQKLPETTGLKFLVEFESRSASVAEVIQGWREDPTFRTLFGDTLSAVPYQAFRWETPAVTTQTLSQPFEFVLLDSPSLQQRPDPETFVKFYPGAKDGVVTFSNLGGDAILVVPCPTQPPRDYSHFAAFLRLAPERQRHALWQMVADAMAKRVSEKPVWLSTAGAGVSWLHVRLDDRPKYYGYSPYRKFPRA